MANEFRYGEERQVHVNALEVGIAYLPVIPYCGATVDHWRNAAVPVTHAVTRVENGTLVRFLEVIGDEHNDEHMWIFALAASPGIQFLVPNSFKPYLWKFKLLPTRKLR